LSFDVLVDEHGDDAKIIDESVRAFRSHDGYES